MKKVLKHVVVIGFIFSTLSCEKLIMKPNPNTDNRSIFNEYITLVKEKYAMLEVKNVDIDQLASTIGATITNDLSESQLFEKLGEVTRALKDGHSTLQTENKIIGFDFTEGYPVAYDVDILINHYIGTAVNPNIKLMYDDNNPDLLVAVYGKLVQDEEIMYLNIPSWDVSITEDQIEKIFSSFVNAKGLIIDIRQNTGGDPNLATKFASYLFGGSKVYIGFERFKTGPGKNDFVNSKVYLEPANSEVRFLKPIVVLTDRFCYSASTTFLYSVNPLGHVTTVGQRSGGGSGSVADGYLANGWKWELSTSEFIDHLGNHLDDGIDPDILVELDTLDVTRDEIIERAILELQ